MLSSKQLNYLSEEYQLTALKRIQHRLAAILNPPLKSHIRHLINAIKRENLSTFFISNQNIQDITPLEHNANITDRYIENFLQQSYTPILTEETQISLNSNQIFKLALMKIDKLIIKAKQGIQIFKTHDNKVLLALCSQAIQITKTALSELKTRKEKPTFFKKNYKIILYDILENIIRDLSEELSYLQDAINFNVYAVCIPRGEFAGMNPLRMQRGNFNYGYYIQSELLSQWIYPADFNSLETQPDKFYRFFFLDAQNPQAIFNKVKPTPESLNPYYYTLIFFDAAEARLAQNLMNHFTYTLTVLTMRYQFPVEVARIIRDYLDVSIFSRGKKILSDQPVDDKNALKLNPH